jgi:hypothetical protein
MNPFGGKSLAVQLADEDGVEAVPAAPAILFIFVGKKHILAEPPSQEFPVLLLLAFSVSEGEGSPC